MTSQEEVNLALSFGFTPELDNRRGYDWNYFFKGDYHVWKGKEGWITAYLIDGFYSVHKSFYELEEAFKNKVG